MLASSGGSSATFFERGVDGVGTDLKGAADASYRGALFQVPQDGRFLLGGNMTSDRVEGEGLVAVHAAAARRSCSVGAVLSQGFIVVAVGAGDGNHAPFLPAITNGRNA